MSIDDHPARANHAHNQKAERIAAEAARKLKSGDKLEAGKDYPVENFESAQGIAQVHEINIREARLNFENSLLDVKAAQATLKDLYEQDQNYRLGFAQRMSDLTTVINDLYIEIDEIVPTSVFPSSLIDDPNVPDPAAAQDYKEALDALSYDETAKLVTAQELLKDALSQRKQLTAKQDTHNKKHPALIEKIEHELKDRLFSSGLALKKLEWLASMRSAEVKQAVAVFDPDEYGDTEEQKAAAAKANLAKAEAYKRGADDDQAQEIWEMVYVDEFYADELEQDRLSAEDLFEDEEKKAAIAERDRLAEELRLLKQDNEVKTQRLTFYGEYVEENAKKSADTVVAERKAWVTLMPHPKDKIHFKMAKEFLNRKKPQGLTEIYLHDTQWDGKHSTHVRRALALRGGVLVDGNKLQVFVGETKGMNKFECVFDCGTKVVLGLQESHEISEKIMIGTAFHHDPRWTQKYENDEDLHGVPDGLSLKASLEPEQLIPYHKILKANLHRAR